MKKVGYLYILVLSLLFLYQKPVKADICGNVTHNSSGNYDSLSCSLTIEEKTCLVKFIKYSDGSAGLYIDGVKQEVLNKKNYSCTSCDVSFSLDNTLENGINDLSNIVVSQVSAVTGKYKFSGIQSYEKDIIICSNDNYNIIVDKDDGHICKVVIKSNPDGNVEMTYGNQKTINPKKGTYTCTVAGDSITFNLPKDLPKNSISSVADCPNITSSAEKETDDDEYTETTNEEEEKEHLDNSEYDNSNKHLGTETGELNCENFIKDDLLTYIEKILSLMKYAGIVLCIGLTIVDFAKAIIGDDKDALNKITKKAFIRIILVALLFFLPTLINFVLNIVNPDACPINF
ncbi:MAG: hypothetical protein ACI4XR_05275 [Bacilli bacterium]